MAGTAQLQAMAVGNYLPPVAAIAVNLMNRAAGFPCEVGRCPEFSEFLVEVVGEEEPPFARSCPGHLQEAIKRMSGGAARLAKEAPR